MTYCDYYAFIAHLRENRLHVQKNEHLKKIGASIKQQHSQLKILLSRRGTLLAKSIFRQHFSKKSNRGKPGLSVEFDSETFHLNMCDTTQTECITFSSDITNCHGNLDGEPKAPFAHCFSSDRRLPNGTVTQFVVIFLQTSAFP